jgi:hypothetical protein
MANYCDTKVRISGDPENLKKLFDKIGEENSFHSENYEILFESTDDVEDWGSKWQNFSEIDYYNGDDMMFITGESAWGPADGLWKKISKDFNVCVTCEYSEPGMGFAGITTWVDGEETDRQEMSYYEYLYDSDNEYFWEDLGYQCEYSSLEEIIESLGDVYENFDDTEKNQLEELHQERYVE